jgi:hypothetical protein
MSVVYHHIVHTHTHTHQYLASAEQQWSRSRSWIYQQLGQDWAGAEEKERQRALGASTFAPALDGSRLPLLHGRQLTAAMYHMA